jgi:long-subunit fatty acid transport protein
MIRIAPRAGALLLLSTTAASALGLDRSGQDIGLLFREGNVAEFSLGLVRPSAEGTDVMALFPGDTADTYEGVGEDFNVRSYGIKFDAGDRLSFAAVLDQPYGTDVSYEGSPVTSLLGGTLANLDSQALTVLGRYEINDAFSVHGGLRQVWSDAEVVLSGQAYGQLNGYRVQLEDGSGTGWVAGVAYERRRSRCAWR